MQRFFNIEEIKAPKCECFYKELPIVDLREIYFKASNEFDNFLKMVDHLQTSDSTQMNLSNINNRRYSQEALFSYEKSKNVYE